MLRNQVELSRPNKSIDLLNMFIKYKQKYTIIDFSSGFKSSLKVCFWHGRLQSLKESNSIIQKIKTLIFLAVLRRSV